MPELKELKEYTVWVKANIPITVVATDADHAREAAQTMIGMYLDANVSIGAAHVRPKTE